MSDISTWHERAMAHPDHQSGMVSEDMTRARMAEEIEDLRAEVKRLRSEKTVRIDRFIRRRMAEAWEDGWFDRDCQEFDWHQNPYKGRRNKP